MPLMPDPIETARIDLAAAFRWADRLGLSEGICNHFSVVVANPDGSAPDKFLINPPATHWREITASKLLLVGFDGSLIEGDAKPEETALYIHYPIHAAAPQATCVLHTHMPYATALTTVEGGRLEPTAGISRLMWGMGAFNPSIRGLVSMAIQENYQLPPIIEAIATDLPEEMWNRERHAGEFDEMLDRRTGSWR